MQVILVTRWFKSAKNVSISHISAVFTQEFRLGDPVKVNASPTPSGVDWRSRVPFIILTVYKTDIIDEQRATLEQKIKSTVDTFTKYHRENSFCIDVTSLKHPSHPIVQLGAKRSSVPPAVYSGAIAQAPPQTAPTKATPAPSSGGGGGGMADKVEVSSASLKCMLSDTAGVLMDDSNKDHLCYFEVSDLNITNPDKVSLKDVVMLLNKMAGVKVRYQARLVNVKGPIQYVSHTKGVQITGQLPGNCKSGGH